MVDAIVLQMHLPVGAQDCAPRDGGAPALHLGPDLMRRVAYPVGAEKCAGPGARQFLADRNQLGAAVQPAFQHKNEGLQFGDGREHFRRWQLVAFPDREPVIGELLAAR